MPRTNHTQYKAKNPGSHAAYQVDENKVFKFLFFSIGPTIDLMKTAGIPMFALDGTHSKNHLGGTILFLVGYDSNGHIRIVAFMFCDGETSENYKLFAVPRGARLLGGSSSLGRPQGFLPEPSVVSD